MSAPRPLPLHCGEIDVAAPFDPPKYFMILRSAGANPYLWRHGDQGVMHSIGGNRPGFFHGPSELDKRRFHEAMAWANSQDRDRKKTNLFLSEITESKAAGNFIHYLGC